MKKLVLILMILLAGVTGLTAQAAPEGLSTETILDLVSGSGEDLENVNIEFIADVISSDQIDTLYDQYAAEYAAEYGVELDESTKETLKEVVKKIESGELKTVGDLQNSDEWGEIEDTIVAIAAEQLVGQILSEEDRTMLETSFGALAMVLRSLSGMGQANANAVSALSLFGYQGYKAFVLSGGTAISLGMKNFNPNNAQELINSIQTESDIMKLFEELELPEVGVSIHAANINFGINAGFIAKGLYLGALFGSSEIRVATNENLVPKVLNYPIGEFDIGLSDGISVSGMDLSFEATMKAEMYGAKLNYQVVKPFTVPVLFHWTGLNFGTGLIYNRFLIDMAASVDLAGLLSDTATEPVDLGLEMHIDSKVFTVPLEISTAIRLLSLVTVGVGAGLDVQFGSGDIFMDINLPGGESIVQKLIRQVLNEAMGDAMSFPLTIPNKPYLLNPRVNLNTGVGVGPIMLDFSLAYFLRSGFAMGINLVVRW